MRALVEATCCYMGVWHVSCAAALLTTPDFLRRYTAHMHDADVWFAWARAVRA